MLIKNDRKDMFSLLEAIKTELQNMGSADTCMCCEIKLKKLFEDISYV